MLQEQRRTIDELREQLSSAQQQTNATDDANEQKVAEVQSQLDKALADNKALTERLAKCERELEQFSGKSNGVVC